MLPVVALAGLVAVLALFAVTRPAPPAPEAAQPSAPDQVSVTPQDTTATATWSREQAESFRVEYSSRPDFTDAQTQQVSRETLGLESLAPGTTYFLRVSTVTGDGERSDPSTPVRFTTSYAVPAPQPTASSETSSTTVEARWKGAGEGAHYETELATVPSFVEPQTVEGTETKAAFSDLDPGTPYWLRVRVLDEDGVPQSMWSPVLEGLTAPSEPLRVATYNVLKSSDRNWPKRRTAVAETIRSQDLDVAGLQEATPITVSPGVRQFADVARLLGPDWSLTDALPQETGEVRTVYNRARLDLIDNGHVEVAGSTRFGVMRYVTWAVFEQKSTGKRFIFVNTHFVPPKTRAAYDHRTSAARQLVDMVESVNTGGLPVVVVGDFNSGDYRTASNGVYRTITGAGYVDPLVESEALGSAEKRINADLKTVNSYARRPPRVAWTPMVDGIFVSPMRVAEWETVAKLDSNGRVIGTIPSDHNMIRTTVFLP